MTKDEATRYAKRKNDGLRGKIGKDGWRYSAEPKPGTVGGFAVMRQRGDASAKELYRSQLN
jgi:hypothetical protein